MTKTQLFLSSLALIFNLTTAKTFYDFNLLDIEGNFTPLSKYKGKITLIVNVASECGYTDPEYEALNKLHEKFFKSGVFEILAFPCNQFGNQEPGSNGEVMGFGGHN